VIVVSRRSFLIMGVTLLLCCAACGDNSRPETSCPVQADDVEACLVVSEAELIPGRGPLLMGELVLGAVAANDDLCLLDSANNRVAVAFARVIEVGGGEQDRVSAPASDVGILVPGTPNATEAHVAVRPSTIC
jgi:hypothetical protein